MSVREWETCEERVVVFVQVVVLVLNLSIKCVDGLKVTLKFESISPKVKIMYISD